MLKSVLLRLCIHLATRITTKLASARNLFRDHAIIHCCTRTPTSRCSSFMTRTGNHHVHFFHVSKNCVRSCSSLNQKTYSPIICSPCHLYSAVIIAAHGDNMSYTELITISCTARRTWQVRLGCHVIVLKGQALHC